MFNKFRSILEEHGFEVLSRISEKLGMRASKLRLWFIYSSFFTLGGTFALYLIGAFFFRIKDNIRRKRPSVFDL